MRRALYRGLVWLHPPAFRREFAGEMLWIYDESAHAGGAASLFLDGFVSLGRQWFLRSGYWKIAVSMAGALLQIVICVAIGVRMGRHRVALERPAANPAELAGLVRLTAFTAVGLLAAVIFLVFWWRRLSRRIGA